MSNSPSRQLFGKRGLANRVALAFALISLVVALVVSGATYFGARLYLVQQRENAALNRALIDARILDAQLSQGARPGKALESLPETEDSQKLLRVDSTWYSSNVSVSPRDLPAELLDMAATSGALQRFTAASGDTYLAVTVPVSNGTFVETFSFKELNSALDDPGLGADRVLDRGVPGRRRRRTGRRQPVGPPIDRPGRRCPPDHGRRPAGPGAGGRGPRPERDLDGVQRHGGRGAGPPRTGTALLGERVA